MSILRDPNGPDGCAQRPPWLSPSELEQEELDAEFGAQFGDPRRCPRHPHVTTSSPDGMHDAPCGVCEAEMDEEAYQARDEEEDELDRAHGFVPQPRR